MFDAKRFNALLAERGLSQSALARRVGISQSAIHKLASGQGQGSKYIHRIAQELGTTPEYLMGESQRVEDDRAEDSAAVGHRSRMDEDRIVEVPMLDLAYGMGGTYLDDIEIEERTEPFPLSFIRRYTKASPDQLVFAEGIGDSMAPTITSNDLLLIDRSQESLTMGDQIWACSFGGVGMVKRLRPRPDGSVAILSDNPNVPDDRAVDEELFLIGRVVAKVSKL